MTREQARATDATKRQATAGAARIRKQTGEATAKSIQAQELERL